MVGIVQLYNAYVDRRLLAIVLGSDMGNILSLYSGKKWAFFFA